MSRKGDVAEALIKRASKDSSESLDLSGKCVQTNGEVPKSIVVLASFLTRLNLSNNGWSQVSPVIGELGQLQSLDLNRNKLTHVPTAILKLKSLTELDLSCMTVLAYL